jgi:uncharacterized small protein (DUF1192 family)
VIFGKEFLFSGKLFYSYWGVALLFSALVIFLLPAGLFKKYLLDSHFQIENTYTQNYFTDLDGDGYSEWIELGKNYGSDSFPYLLAKTEIYSDFSAQRLYQINFAPLWYKYNEPIFGDYDNNGRKEAYFTAISNDSLFLMGVDPLKEKNHFLQHYICMISIRENTYDFQVHHGGLFDLNDDGYKEVVFNVCAGFHQDPRKFYAYDIKKDTLIVSNTNYIGFTDFEAAYSESSGWVFTSANYTCTNIDTNVAADIFTDRKAWIFALDTRLDFLFDPIGTQSNRAVINLKLFSDETDVVLVGYLRDQKNRKNQKLLKYDLQGKLLKEEILDVEKYSQVSFLTIENTPFIHFPKNKNYILAKLNNDLKIDWAKKIKPFSHILPFDFDEDGVNEFLAWNKSKNELLVYRNDFSHPANIELDIKAKEVFFSLLKTIDEHQYLAIQSGAMLSFLSYQFNKYYYLKYPFWIAIYLFFASTLYLLLKFQRKSLQKKYELENRMTELELLTIKNQIDPHFIINALNALGSVIFQSETEKQKSYQFLVNLITLIRDTLQNSREISVSLAGELEFVKHYLEVQQFRYSNRFDFRIINNIAEPEKIEIPKMIIQTFAENAVKHGLAHKINAKGKVMIKVENVNSRINIIIEDNGIGREQAKTASKGSTGKGLQIIRQIVAMYNRLKRTSVRFYIEDVLSDDNPAGTRIVVLIPAAGKK